MNLLFFLLQLVSQAVISTDGNETFAIFIYENVNNLSEIGFSLSLSENPSNLYRPLVLVDLIGPQKHQIYAIHQRFTTSKKSTIFFSLRKITMNSYKGHLGALYSYVIPAFSEAVDIDTK